MCFLCVFPLLCQSFILCWSICVKLQNTHDISSARVSPGRTFCTNLTLSPHTVKPKPSWSFCTTTHLCTRPGPGRGGQRDVKGDLGKVNDKTQTSMGCCNYLYSQQGCRPLAPSAGWQRICAPSPRWSDCWAWVWEMGKREAQHETLLKQVILKMLWEGWPGKGSS